jgi:hypothetical protein
MNFSSSIQTQKLLEETAGSSISATNTEIGEKIKNPDHASSSRQVLLHSLSRMQVQRVCSVVPGALHLGSLKTAVLKPITLQDLVVSKVESSLHLVQASLDCIISIAATRLATHKVGNKWPTVIAIARMVLLHHFLIQVHNAHPVAMQIVRLFQKHFLGPQLTLCYE